MLAALASVAILVVGSGCTPAAPTAATAAPAAPVAATQAPTAIPKPAAAPTAAPVAATLAPTAVPKPAATLAPTQAPTAVPKPAPTTLLVSLNAISADLTSLWIAMDDGTFADRGITVDAKLIESTIGVPALLTGQTQVAIISGTEVLSADVVGADLVVIGALAPVVPLAFMAQPSIKTVEDLKGKKVGVSNFGSSSDIAARVALRRLGLDPEKDVVIVPLGGLSTRTAAMISGAVQAGPSLPPDWLPLKDMGWHIMYDLAGSKVASPGSSIVVKKTFLDANRDLIQRFIDGIIIGIKRQKTDKPYAVSILLKNFKSTDERAMNEVYDYFSENVSPAVPLPAAEQYADALSELSKSNPAAENFDVTKIFDVSFVNSAVSRGLSYKP